MSFINPLFLFATSAALLPILYHLIRRMRARKVRFSSLLFLRATPKALVKRRKLRDILLLIIRVCILGLLALVFARPFFPRESVPVLLQASDRSTVILLDNSYSMQYGDLFARAKDEALDIIDRAGPADEIAVVVFSDTPRQVSELSTDFTLLRNVVTTAVTVSNRITDLYQPLRLAEEILKNAHHVQREVVLISDFQNNGWSGQLDNWHLAGDVTFVPRKIAGERVSNTYIGGFADIRRRIGDAESVQFRLQIATQGPVSEGNRVVSLWLNGREIDSKTVETAQSNQVFFQEDNLREGDYQGYVMLGDDDLAVDNYRYFTVASRKRPSVLCVDSAPASPRSNAFFLANCFSMGDQAQYAFSSGGPELLTADVVNAQDVVFLADVSSLTSRQVALLREFLENGGGIIVSFGDQTNLQQMSDGLRALGIGSLEEQVDAWTAQSSYAIISDVDYSHPVFSVFSSAGAGDISRPRFREYLRVIPDADAVVIGTYNTGDPFMIERRVGKGKILAVTSSLDTEWGDFPVNEIFLPFVYQVVKYALSSGELPVAFAVGDPVPLNGDPGDDWEVQAPGEKIYRVTTDDAGNGYFRETEAPGNYRAISGGAQRFFSVNVDTRESDLTAKDVTEAAAAVAGPRDQSGYGTQTAGIGNVTEEEASQKLWRLVLFLIIVLFVGETFLANRKMDMKFGRTPDNVR